MLPLLNATKKWYWRNKRNGVNCASEVILKKKSFIFFEERFDFIWD